MTSTLSASALSDDQRAVLRTLADTVLPSMPRDDDPTGFWAASGSSLGVDVAVAQVISEMPAEQQVGLGALLDGLHAQGFTPGRPQDVREQLLSAVAASSPAAEAGIGGLVGLTTMMAYSNPDPTTGVNVAWKQWGYAGPPQQDDRRAFADNGPDPLPTYTPTGEAETIDADVCIVGSGAGGGVISGMLAKAGLNVVVLEAGSNKNEADFNGYELQALKELFWGGGFWQTPTGNMAALTAKTLGGGPTVNWQNFLRTPDWVRENWAEEFGLKDVATPDYDEDLDAIWTRQGVNDGCSDYNESHKAMQRGAEALGWNFHRLSRNSDPRYYRFDAAGHTGYGDGTGAKIDLRSTYLRDVVEAGGQIIVNCHADRVLVEDGRGVGVAATYTNPQTGAETAVTVRAPKVVVAGGSPNSPALLLRSGIGGPAVGKNLHMHPVLSLLALYPQQMSGWLGGPMTGQVDQFANLEDGHGTLLQNAQWFPAAISTGVARESFTQHKETMARLGQAAMWVGIPRDRSSGSVTIDGDGRPVINYELYEPVDERVNNKTLEGQIRMHHAAGADEIIPMAETFDRWRRGEDLEAFIERMQSMPKARGGHRLLCAHQMSACRLGTDPETSVANPNGELHDTPGVYIGDASGFPTATGANPMLTTMAMAHRFARLMIAELGATGGRGLGSPA